MRSLLYKNLTSTDKKRRIISASEIADREGVRSIVHRHFIYIVKEAKSDKLKSQRPLPYLYILKERNRKEQREKFFCRIKGRAYVLRDGRPYLILFMHSLKITLTAAPDKAIY